MTPLQVIVEERPEAVGELGRPKAAIFKGIPCVETEVEYCDPSSLFGLSRYMVLLMVISGWLKSPPVNSSLTW